MSNLPVVTAENAHDISRQIHEHFMNRITIRPGMLAEVVFCGLGVGGEGGEVADAVKKYWRDPELREEHREAIAKEIADVWAYLHHLARALDIDIEQAFIEKTQECVHRWPFIFEEETNEQT